MEVRSNARTRALIALAISLTAHVLLFVLLREDAEEEPAGRAAPKPIEVELHWLAPAPEATTTPKIDQPKTPSRRSVRRLPPTSTGESERAPPSDQVTPPASNAGPAAPHVTAPDAPRAAALSDLRSLNPTLPTQTAPLAPAPDETDDERARVGARVTGWLEQAKAAAHAGNGRTSDRLEEMKGALGAGAHALRGDGMIGVGFGSLGSAIENYGKNGALITPGAHLSEAPPALVDSLTRVRGVGGLVQPPDAKKKTITEALNATSEDLPLLLHQGALLRAFADGDSSRRYRAVVALTPGSDCGHPTVELVEPSGVVVFDDLVLKRARATTLPCLVDAGVMARRRSRWAFTGKWTHHAPANHLTLADLGSLLALLPAGLATGRFDLADRTFELDSATNGAIEVSVTLVGED